MSWIVFVPLVLTASFVVVLWPVFSKNGNAPLPLGLEDNPRIELESRRIMLLGQLKEMERVGGNTESLAEGRVSLETELADVFGQLDAVNSGSAEPAPLPVDGRASATDKGFAGTFLFFTAAISILLYALMGTTAKIELPARPPVESTAEMNQMLDQAIQKLQQEPDNLVGWKRLARSLEVMQRVGDAMQAYIFILQHHPQDMEARVSLAELKVQNGESEAEIKEGAEMFKAILAEEPDNQDALWFLGGLAMRGGNNEGAVGYWTRLLERLPPNDPNRGMVQQALDKLKKP